MSVSTFDSADGAYKVKSHQKKFRASFGEASLNPDIWDSSIGTGGAMSQAAGALTMSSGTTINAETSILSKETFTIPFRVMVGMSLSQRIANQTFFIEMISVNKRTGLPDGKHCASWAFDGTTATQAKYEVQNSGQTKLTSVASTITSTASAAIHEIEPFCDEVYFHSKALDSVAARSTSYARQRDIPDPNALYKIRLRWLNGGTAPASNSDAVILFVSCSDYMELTTEITASRGNTAAGLGMAVHVAGSVTLPVAGFSAHDGAIAGNPFRAAGRALSAAYTTVSTGDTADLITTLQGVLVTRPWQIPENEWSYAAAAAGIVNTTTAVTIKAAAAAGVKNYITSIDVFHESLTTATELAIRDGAAGAVIWRTKVPSGAAGRFSISFENPLRGTAATLLEVVTLTASGAGAVYFNATGFIAA